MHVVYLRILMISTLLLAGCSSQRKAFTAQGDLPILRQQPELTIAQVAANFDDSVQRDHPYFMVCDSLDCPTASRKTSITQVAINTSGQQPVENPSNSVAAKNSRNVPVENTTYLKKTSSLLGQFRVHFEYASALIATSYQGRLKSFVEDYPHKQSQIRVTGYTDNISIPDGTVANEWLALDRAAIVKKYLVSLGYPKSQILLEARFLCCYIDSNKNEAGQRNNRRAEISIINQINH